MNYFKYFFASLVAVMCVAFAMPVDAAVAVKRQEKNRTQQSGVAKAHTDDHGVVRLCFGGVHSINIYADAQGRTHLKYKETATSPEQEFIPSESGYEFDQLPEPIVEYMSLHPGVTVKQAIAAMNLPVMSLVYDDESFWDEASIYLGDASSYSNKKTTTVNTKLVMTGGKIFSVCAAGHYEEQSEEAHPMDNGNASIYIQGGEINYVAASTSQTKYFSGTVGIYLQDCRYVGDYIPNVTDDNCAITFLSTGVTYTEPNTLMNLTENSDYECNARYSILQNPASTFVTCKSRSGVLTIPAGLKPINCTTFRITDKTSVVNNAEINCTNFYSPFAVSILKSKEGSTTFDKEPLALTPIELTYSFRNSASGVVNANKISIGSNYTVYNLGTMNAYCDGLTNEGTWATSYTETTVGGRKVIHTCNPLTIKHYETTKTVTETNTVINFPCTHVTTSCSKCLLKLSESWSNTNKTTGIYIITDSSPFEYGGTTEVQFYGIQYNRTFSNTNFQPLYIPFELAYDRWKDLADIYKIKNIHEYDRGYDGNIDEWTLEIVKLKEGQTTKPNTPYVIRPKSTGYVTLRSERGATLYATNTAKAIDCSSTDCLYKFTGTPVAKTLVANKEFYMTGGNLMYSPVSQQLGAYRWYMSIFDRESGEQIQASQFNAAKKISVFCEDDDTTGILELEESVEADVPADAVIYDLNGQKVTKMIDGKIYIVNGKKFKK